MNAKRNPIMPTDAEDAAINAAIATDPDNPEWTDAMFASATSVADSNLPASFKQAVLRGKQTAPTKKPISIRLSPEVLDFFRDQGKGWQTRMDEVLKDYVAHH
ncbi:MAG: BrnA antitoxin family protein [Ghiorsea sp.]